MRASSVVVGLVLGQDRVGVPMGVAHNAEGRGIIAFDRGELGAAAIFITKAIEIFVSYGNVGCTAHALEAAAVVIGTADRDDGSLATELLAAAKEFRRQSGVGHRAWEIRARLGALEDRIISPGTTTSGAAHNARPQYTLSVTASLATQALRSVAASTAR